MGNCIEKFNSVLNNSVCSGEIYQRWFDYRASITKFAVSNMINGGNVIIVGAGNLFDINIEEISANSTGVTLADIDVETVAKGLADRKIEQQKISIVKTDFGGMDSNDIFNNIDEFINSDDAAGMKKLLNNYTFGTSEYSVKGTFDTVFLSSVYTQMFIPQFLEKLRTSILNEERKSVFLETALSFSARLIARINGEIIDLGKKDATVCAWSDILEYQNNDNALQDINRYIEDEEWMDSLYNTYFGNYGHGLGSYGISNLADRLVEVGYKWMMWPFDESRSLIVKIIHGKIK